MNILPPYPPGGSYLLGGNKEATFVFDNEKWAHPVTVDAFRIARAPVTHKEFAAFVNDGGYTCQEWWSKEGWAWCQTTNAAHPLYWIPQENDRWLRQRFDQQVVLEEYLPVLHVNWFEAMAYCAWAKRRLPTEVEWEIAAAYQPTSGVAQKSEKIEKSHYPWGNDSPTPAHANLDWQAMDCIPVAACPEGDSAFGCRQMIGNIWEWTSSVFRPYPGFVADPYKEYSEPWFETRKVLRGGAWTTRSRLIRNTWRNYYTPDRRDVWGGFRTCAQHE